MTQKFVHPTYQVSHTCGHTVTKQVLEATEYKRRQVVRMMELKPCIECLKASYNQ